MQVNSSKLHKKFNICFELFTKSRFFIYPFHTEIFLLSPKQRAIGTRRHANTMCILHKFRARFSTSSRIAQIFIFCAILYPFGDILAGITDLSAVLLSSLAFRRKQFCAVKCGSRDHAPRTRGHNSRRCKRRPRRCLPPTERRFRYSPPPLFIGVRR